MDINQQLNLIRSSYDRTVSDFNKGIAEEDLLPPEFTDSEGYKRFRSKSRSCSSGNPAIMNYLNPAKGMRYLDLGSCVNLIGYGLHKWPADYYGIDFSIELCKANSRFAVVNGAQAVIIAAEAASLPFPDKFFDISSVIGLLEYYDIGYIERILKELNRVLSSRSRIMLDIPDSGHQDFETMVELENLLGRTRYNLPAGQEFEDVLNGCFRIISVDRSEVMNLYCLEKR